MNEKSQGLKKQLVHVVCLELKVKQRKLLWASLWILEYLKDKSHYIKLYLIKNVLIY